MWLNPRGFNILTSALIGAFNSLMNLTSITSSEISGNGSARTSNLLRYSLMVPSCFNGRNFSKIEPSCDGWNRSNSQHFNSSQLRITWQPSSHWYQARGSPSKQIAVASIFSQSDNRFIVKYLLALNIHPSGSSPLKTGISSLRDWFSIFHRSSLRSLNQMLPLFPFGPSPSLPI